MFYLDKSKLKFTFIRAQGPGGQHVNKAATAVQLRFNISSLPDDVRSRLLSIASKKITDKGDLIIKADRYRSQEHNKEDALNRLITLLKRAAITPKKRKKTKPTLASIERRLSQKKLHSKTKSMRRIRSSD